MVDAWQLPNWEAYRDVARLGRKTRLPGAQRQVLWSMFESVRENLAGRKLITESAMFAKLADTFAGNARSVPFDFAVLVGSLGVGSLGVGLFALGSAREPARFPISTGDGTHRAHADYLSLRAAICRR